MFTLNNISVTFGGLRALDGISLEIARGETTVLIGPSGCGKSTLIRCLIGLIRPNAGTVLFDGQPLTPDTVWESRRRMGYVIQEGGLFPHLTARENAAVMARHIGWSRQRIDDRLEELSALTHFPADALRRFPVELSGGQRQRVSLMRALMLDPDVLLLDEPLGALDPLIRADLQNDLKSVFRTLKKTVVLVTHDMGEAAFFGDRIVLMRAGAIVQDGSITALLRQPAEPFVTHFINAQRSPLEAFGPHP